MKGGLSGLPYRQHVRAAGGNRIQRRVAGMRLRARLIAGLRQRRRLGQRRDATGRQDRRRARSVVKGAGDHRASGTVGDNLQPGRRVSRRRPSDTARRPADNPSASTMAKARLFKHRALQFGAGGVRANAEKPARASAVNGARSPLRYGC